METFCGQAHLPGTDDWHVELDIDWGEKEINVHIDEAPGGMADWPGLAGQTFGPVDEIVFRTKGIPRLFTHWWHFVCSGSGDLWGTCPVPLAKVK